MNIPAAQPFVPVLVGNDVGSYSLAREFHEAYGVKSVVVPTAGFGNLRHSSILRLFRSSREPRRDDVLDRLASVAAELTDHGESPRPLLLMVDDDELVRTVVDRRQELGALGYTIPYPNPLVLDQIASEDTLAAACADVGLARPRVVAYDLAEHTAQRAGGFARDELPAAGLSFPVDLRHEGRTQLRAAEDPEALVAALEEAAGSGASGRMFVVERIPGPDSLLRLVTCFADQTGAVRLSAHGEVIVEQRTPGHEGRTPAVLAARDEHVEGLAAALLRRLGWRGFAVLTLKVDPRDDTAKLIGISPRLGRDHHYLTAAGINPVRFAVEEHLNGGLAGLDTAATSYSALYTTLPLPLVRRYADTDQRRRIALMVDRDAVVDPFRYEADSGLRRRLRRRMGRARAYRDFRRFPPPTA
ncbi:MAG: hypothetical protein Q4F53_09550 [Nesterenkonia sp.]|nr:hypothetical protein [Nesterenkonia sp.]